MTKKTLKKIIEALEIICATIPDTTKIKDPNYDGFCRANTLLINVIHDLQCELD